VDNNHHRAPGSQKEESILVAATAFLFAEGVETGTLIGATCGRVLHPAESRRIGDPGVLDEVGGGEPSLSLRRHCLRTGGSVLLSSLVDPRKHIAIASTILGATDGGIRGAASHAVQRRAMVFGTPLPGGLAPFGKGAVGAAWLACPPLHRKMRGPSHAGRAQQARTGSEGWRNGAGGNTLPPGRTRGSDARVALARRSNRSRSRQLAVLAQRSGRFHFTSIWKRPGTGV